MTVWKTARLLVPIWAAIFAAPGLAEVRIEILPDGKKVIRGSGSTAAKSQGKRWTPRARQAPAELEQWIRENADRVDLDPDLLRAVIQVESGFNPRATSHKGAMGLMQLMPQTAASLAVRDPYDPRQNVRGGADYLRKMLRRFGRVDYALAAYNAGPEAVDRYSGIPPYRETRDYVRKVMSIQRRDPSYRLPAATSTLEGAKTYLYRGSDGSLRMSTDPQK